MADDRSAYLQECLDRLRRGEAEAREDLLRGACRRLTELTRAMLKGYRRLKRWEETDDVVQGALLRLHRALQAVRPETPRDFYRLATTQIRRELIDLARHYFGPAGHGRNLESVAAAAPGEAEAGPLEGGDRSLDPGRLAAWTDFHRQAEALPDGERDVFELVWYQGLKQAEAAALLGVSGRTVIRRWQAACRKMGQALQSVYPDLTST
jgi:RNA polymerase sigma-70 factor (ECF subfamily)